MQKIAKDIFIETHFRGVTVGAIFGPEGVVCIDTPTHPADARAWKQQVEEQAQKPVRFVINLDHQRDRILGNQWFEAPVIAHIHTQERLRLQPEWFKNSPPDVGADSEGVDDVQGLRVTAPTITFADRMTLNIGSRELHLVHRPGSAPGALWVEIPSAGVVFTGDSVTHKIPPMLHDADLANWFKALAELRKKTFPAKTIVPGRGPATTKESVKALEDFLKLAERKVTTLMRSRRSRSELEGVARELLGKYTTTPENRVLYARRLRAGLEHIYDRLALTGGR
ncbi:MAG: MBL fold metallo-hydrolase [Anaerolineales bacterium]|nr:MBL fold metallo-hydrolase [Anaerolineales bacterium]